MQKSALLFGLALTALSTGAFYLNGAASTSYLMMIDSERQGPKLGPPELTTVWPDGRKEVQPLPALKISTDRLSTAAAVDLHRAELLKINSLYA